MDPQTIELLLLFTLGFVGLVELLLTWRVWRLERRMLQVMTHFIKAKEFLGGIEKTVGNYKGVAEAVANNGLDVKLHSDKLGEFQLTIKGKKPEN